MARLSKGRRKPAREVDVSPEPIYVLSETAAEALFSYLNDQLAEQSCSGTLQLTEAWLKEQFDVEMQSKIIMEIQAMGGHCDCEVLLNCYEAYHLNDLEEDHSSDEE